MDLKEHDVFIQKLLKSMGTDKDTQLIQTHISTIILSGDLAYKLKKPVDFGFLDYSTLAKRHKNCLEEVRINKGFAPKLYLGVVPITGSIENPQINGNGRVLDYAVKMRRFEQDDQLDHVVEQDGLEIESMDKLAEVIARFHNTALRVHAASDYGNPERVLSPMQENFEQLQTNGADHAVEEKLETVKAWMYRQFDKLRPLLKRRKADGFVRECHGDMHLHNMAWHEGELILFDAIEFNPYLNHIDVISDLAFLLMDLEYRGLLRHSRRLLNRYLELTGDYEGAGLLDFYKTYRAMVRAKVAALRVAQEIEPDERRKVMDEMIGYSDLALSYTEKKSLFLAVMHGFSGSGKSTCALMMVEQYGALRIRSDVERMRMFEKADISKTSAGLQKGIYTPDATEITYRRLAELAGMIVQNGHCVVVDATFLKQWQRQLFLKLSYDMDVPFFLFDLQCDTQMMRERVEKRTDEGIDISEANTDVLEMQIKHADALTDEEKKVVFSIDCTTLDTMRKAIEAAKIV